MTRPRVTVVLPTRDRTAPLRAAIASVLAQTFADLELVVVDDASVEIVEPVVASFGDSRVRYLRRAQGGGPGAARNDGIRAARGELIAFQDSDDQWLATKLERQVATLDRAAADAALCCCGYFTDHETGRPRYVSPSPEALTEQAVLTHFHFFPPMWLVRREALLRAGLFDEALPSREDWELAIRLRATGAFAGIDEPGVIRTTAGGGVSANLPAHAASLRWILARHAARFAPYPAALAGHWRELGLLEFLFEDARRGRRSLLRAAATAPPGLRALAWWCGTHVGRAAALTLQRHLRERKARRRVDDGAARV